MMNNVERKEVRLAMLKLFRSYKQLEIFLMDEFDIACNQFGDQSKSLEEVIFDLIETFNSSDMLQLLVERLSKKYSVDFRWQFNAASKSKRKAFTSASVHQEGERNIYIEKAEDMNITM
jgi:hypothetical protein